MAKVLTQLELQTLLENAQKARDMSYSPYSKFRVGASLYVGEGVYVNGTNIENASSPAGICAERTALVKALLEGHKNFVAIAVASDLDAPCSPCGICRQVLREFCDLHLPVYMVNSSWHVDHADSKVISKTLEELLPLSFGPAHLL